MIRKLPSLKFINLNRFESFVWRTLKNIKSTKLWKWSTLARFERTHLFSACCPSWAIWSKQRMFGYLRWWFLGNSVFGCPCARSQLYWLRRIYVIWAGNPGPCDEVSEHHSAYPRDSTDRTHAVQDMWFRIQSRLRIFTTGQFFI